MEKETRKIPRKIIEGCYIRANLDECVNLNEGMGGYQRTIQRVVGGLATEGQGIKQEELSPGTRPQLQPDGRPELVWAKYR